MKAPIQSTSVRIRRYLDIQGVSDEPCNNALHAEASQLIKSDPVVATMSAYLYLSHGKDDVYCDEENGPSDDDIYFNQPFSPKDCWKEASSMNRKAGQGIFGMHSKEMEFCM